MADTKHEPNALSTDQLEKIGGGECTPSDMIQILGDLTQAYENLIDFSSHVIERVLNGVNS